MKARKREPGVFAAEVTIDDCRKTLQKRGFFFSIILFTILSLQIGGCLNGTICPLPKPFCGGEFPLNTQNTTPYGPPWANVTTSSSDWITCFGPYALCFYAQCTPVPGSAESISACPCFETFGVNFVDINAILNNDVYNETKIFCTNNPGACQQPNLAPVCQSLNSGSFLQGATIFSDFGLYRAAKEPIGSTDCTNQPGKYAGCMTAPCFGQTRPGTDPGTTMIECECPNYTGPFQLGKDDLSCNVAPFIDSGSYNPGSSSPSSPCDQAQSCIPDLPTTSCGCGLYVPGTTVLPPNSGVNCAKVCEEYNTCQNSNNIELGYTCDATLCTSENHDLLFDACNGLQNCDLSEVFKAESAAHCSCCASQLCGCNANLFTNAKISTLNAAQRSGGDTPQCDINGTLCGL